MGFDQHEAQQLSEATRLHIYVVIGDGSLQRVDPDGTRHAPRPMKDGEVHFREVDGEAVHEAVNAGNTPWRNIVVELKKAES